MKILCDTSVIVEIDRHNEKTVHLLQKLIEKGHELLISAVTVSEILTGSYLTKDVKTSVTTAKEILNQFSWNDFDGETAEITAKLFSYLILQKRQDEIEYPDVLIAAAFIAKHCDSLLTLNKKDFVIFPNIEKFVYTPEELIKKLG